jgi:hypothetical protein
MIYPAKQKFILQKVNAVALFQKPCFKNAGIDR